VGDGGVSRAGRGLTTRRWLTGPSDPSIAKHVECMPSACLGTNCETVPGGILLSNPRTPTVAQLCSNRPPPRRRGTCNRVVQEWPSDIYIEWYCHRPAERSGLSDSLMSVALEWTLAGSTPPAAAPTAAAASSAAARLLPPPRPPPPALSPRRALTLLPPPGGLPSPPVAATAADAAKGLTARPAPLPAAPQPAARPPAVPPLAPKRRLRRAGPRCTRWRRVSSGSGLCLALLTCLHQALPLRLARSRLQGRQR